jgi:hypothetical protein
MADDMASLMAEKKGFFEVFSRVVLRDFWMVEKLVA